MRLVHPEWTSCGGGGRRGQADGGVLGREPLLATDLHPDGSRLVTGGHGDDANTGKICFWNMKAIRSVAHQLDDASHPKLLCTLHVHLRCVNALRWNRSGSKLASAGEDGFVMIWEYSNSAGGGGGVPEKTFGSDTVNHESWRNSHILKGHTGSVLDVSWHPRDLYLASAGHDNLIFIWNAASLPQKVTVLSKHSNIVKGVSWCPIGFYLASQSDDKSLRIWNVRDWTEAKAVSEPFSRATSSTHVLRCDWSPDGQHLLATQAVNGEANVAKMADRRSNFSCNLELAGHRKDVRCVRFHPRLLYTEDDDDGHRRTFSLVAIGSKDRSISVWRTSCRRPILVLHEVFDDAVTDLSWSRTSFELAAVSRDGSLACLLFHHTEIGGLMMSSPEQDKHLETLYGDYLSAISTSAIVQNPDILQFLKSQHNSDTSPAKQQQQQRTPLKSLPLSTKQVEVRSKDGRRRITPVCIAPPPVEEATGEASVPVPFGEAPAHNGVSSTTNGDLPHTHVSTASPDQPQGFQSPDSSSSALIAPACKHNLEDFDDPPVEATIFDARNKPEILPEVVAVDTASEAEEDDEIVVVRKKKDRPPKRPLDTDPSEVCAERPPKAKKKNDGSRAGNKQQQQPDVKMKGVQKKRARPESPISWKPFRTDSEYETDEDGGADVSEDEEEAGNPTISITLIPSDPIRDHFSVERSESGTLAVTNNRAIGGGDGTSSTHLHSIHFTSSRRGERPGRRGQQQFDSVFQSAVMDGGVGSDVVAVVCEDHTLSVFNHSGHLLAPPLLVDARPARLVVEDGFVMVVTTEASVSVWETRDAAVKCVLYNSSVANLWVERPGVTLLRALLLPRGVPVLVLSTCRSYCFRHDLNCWTVLQDKSLAAAAAAGCVKSPPQLPSSGSLAMVSQLTPAAPTATSICLNLLDHISSPTSGGGASLETERLQLGLSVKYMQVLECSARSVSSTPAEYNSYLLSLVSSLAAAGCEPALKSICDSLLTPVLQHNSHSSSTAHRIDTLKAVLAVIASNLRLQRLFGEYNQILKHL